MISLIATAVLGLAAMGEGEEPEEDEDLLTLLGHVLSVEVVTAGGGAYEVFIYDGNERIGHGWGRYGEALIEALQMAESSPTWPLQEIRDAAVKAMVASGGVVKDRWDAYGLLDSALAKSDFKFFSSDLWFDGRSY